MTGDSSDQWNPGATFSPYVPGRRPPGFGRGERQRIALKLAVQGAFWIFVYLAVAVAPLDLAVAGEAGGDVDGGAPGPGSVLGLAQEVADELRTLADHARLARRTDHRYRP